MPVTRSNIIHARKQGKRWANGNKKLPGLKKELQSDVLKIADLKHGGQKKGQQRSEKVKGICTKGIFGVSVGMLSLRVVT